MYKFNPKTKGSGILGCIPQTGICPNLCEDCFFQSGRSFLEPLEENLPNIPPAGLVRGRVVRVNDGNDSFYLSKEQIENIILAYDRMCFFNTSIPHKLEKYSYNDCLAPVVLTINPGKHTDTLFIRLDPTPENLMMVRVRVNTWNLDLVEEAVEHYSQHEIPIILTFMAYFDIADKIPGDHRQNYRFRKRTTNEYYAITTEAWERVMLQFKYNPFDLIPNTKQPKLNKWVYSCGLEGELGTSACHRCGNCLREFYFTMEKLRGEE